MSSKTGVSFKLLLLVIVAVAAGWMVWKGTPPYQAGAHDVVVEAKGGDAGPEARTGPRLGNCEVLPADNIWNTPIDKLLKDRRTEEYVGSIGPEVKLHPDFGTDIGGGIPFTEITPYQRKVGVSFEYADESDLGNYPIPADAPIEGGTNSRGDRHVLLVDTTRCLLYEIFEANPKPDGTWSAGSAVRLDMTSNSLRQEGWTSADAAGLPIFPGLVRYDEVKAGEIRHAIRFTVQHTQAAYLWPARHKASSVTDRDVPPMGLRMRLRGDFDISGYSRANQVILTAMKRYGIILADNGGSMFVTGVPDKRWDDGDLHKLSQVRAEDFEAVDESELQLLPNSGRVDPVALRP